MSDQCRRESTCTPSRLHQHNEKNTYRAARTVYASLKMPTFADRSFAKSARVCTSKMQERVCERVFPNCKNADDIRAFCMWKNFRTQKSKNGKSRAARSQISKSNACGEFAHAKNNFAQATESGASRTVKRSKTSESGESIRGLDAARQPDSRSRDVPAHHRMKVFGAR